MGGEEFGTSVRQVADGVYVFRWWIYRNMFVVTDEGVIATDPFNHQAARLLSDEIQKVTDKPVKYVIYSHNHHDHISGGITFEEEGAEFIGHENVVKELGDHPSPVTPIPGITFKDRYTLTLGGRTVELEYYGPNHGDGLAHQLLASTWSERKMRLLYTYSVYSISSIWRACLSKVVSRTVT